MIAQKLTQNIDRKHCVDAHVHRIGLAHDTRRWVRTASHSHPTITTPNISNQLFLFRSRSKKISLVALMAFCDGNGGRFLPMVLLGIFSGIFTQSRQIYGCSGQLRPHGCTSAAICRQPPDSRSALLRLPRHVRLYHVSSTRYA